MKSWLHSAALNKTASLPAWGEWIEIIKQKNKNPTKTGLSPLGESGLKYIVVLDSLLLFLSLSPLGESGLKLYRQKKKILLKSLSPLGESGLKSPVKKVTLFLTPVSPRLGKVD